jgi:hypothetical protein
VTTAVTATIVDRWRGNGEEDMDIGEANKVLDGHVGKLRAHPYSELKRLVERRIIQAPEIQGPSGGRVQAFWDDQPQGNVRIMVSIDDGGKADCVRLLAASSNHQMSPSSANSKSRRDRERRGEGDIHLPPAAHQREPALPQHVYSDLPPLR